MGAVPAVKAPWTQTGGVTAFTRGEAQKFARSILNSQTYRDWLEERVKNKTLHQSTEQMLWHYGYGKPTEHIDLNLSAEEDLSSMSVIELLQRAEDLRKMLEEARALEEAIPAQFKVQP